ncbi:hypothetical protein A2331_03580 [Candidatus Falkowbacteria bacterium RIFOXYB2_FULL_34_18]|uniref:General secretion pathway GspH domain-containing protein n=1 Tax=Candidatus Falkowbacteria bacterium RIFOXYD2_FULL_34_120 TaxID=1798007 RepID=A0A1F5TSK8_9BACT|nr:MAG: hypothetical protein A2331_03580 [Candidatus Falkowbacteria bacterium RIFOXYB2_FULL_34_18]OGF30098.1 MAG: hypothetical protein A2500_04870 [Candidatus Falkowbacteria bacterium RIFOXYC12_FULL_34_55]OGF37568.1 MAG: hypothetical protein A2466_01975 [Candidatus Falkowbacteria bacterium RIFOXYC2_FULL_34_220]OGF39324.1 MAG: hypothetical protein A2515_02390 [Candidatus Falkowbacteria bacterium RIFOXYD12_FULL_34_57]OGF41829.1 MAG: hypothetical protein A2531_05375 [Candidatus Falkowbacteria bact
MFFAKLIRIINPEHVPSKQSNFLGFSIIEVLIVVAIFIILSAISLPFYNNLNIELLVDKTRTDIVQTLRLIKIKSESRVNNSAHGVYFDANTMTLYQGSSYEQRNNDYDQEFLIDDVLLVNYNLSSSDINFSKGLGLPSATGTIQILSDLIDAATTISINNLGVIDFD